MSVPVSPIWMPGERCCLEQVETSAGNGPGRGEAVGGSLGQVQGETGAKCQGCSKAACRRGPRKEQESTAGSPYPLPPWDRGWGARACCRGPCRKVESGRAWSFQVELGQSKTGRWWEPVAGWCPAWGGRGRGEPRRQLGSLRAPHAPCPHPLQANETFAFVGNVTHYAQVWLNISAEIRSFLEQGRLQQHLHWLQQVPWGRGRGVAGSPLCPGRRSAQASV